MNTRLILALGFFFLAMPAHAATLSTGTGGTHAVGELFTIPVLVSAQNGEALNTVEATLSYNPNYLSVVGIRDAGIIDIWPEKASFSNTQGTISFLGVIYNPGFLGKNGVVLSVTFKVLKEGSSNLSFSNAHVLANDGQGTEILQVSSGTSVQGSPKIVLPVQTSSPGKQKEEQPVSSASSTAPSTLLDVNAEPSQPPTQTSVFDETLIIVGLIASGFLFALILVIAAWYFWHRLHPVRRHLLRHIARTDTALHAELIELHRELFAEVERLTKEEDKRQLTHEEKRILTRFTYLVEKTRLTLRPERERSVDI